MILDGKVDAEIYANILALFFSLRTQIFIQAENCFVPAIGNRFVEVIYICTQCYLSFAEKEESAAIRKFYQSNLSRGKNQLPVD
jgi:hypothetical protein